MKSIFKNQLYVMKYAIYLTFLISFIIPSNMNAQNLVADSLYEIETIEGNKYAGLFVGMEGNIFSFQSKELGNIKLKPEQIKHCFLIEKDQVRNGKIWPANIQPSRYFFAPSGYGLKQGEAYYQNIWVLFNQVSYGVSDNLTVGVGTIPFFLFKESKK